MAGSWIPPKIMAGAVVNAVEVVVVVVVMAVVVVLVLVAVMRVGSGRRRSIPPNSPAQAVDPAAGAASRSDASASVWRTAGVVPRRGRLRVRMGRGRMTRLVGAMVLLLVIVVASPISTSSSESSSSGSSSLSGTSP